MGCNLTIYYNIYMMFTFAILYKNIYTSNCSSNKQISSEGHGMGCFFTNWPRNPRGLQNKSAVNSSWLLLSPGHRSLLLKIPPTLVAKYRERKLELSRKLPSCWLVSSAELFYLGFWEGVGVGIPIVYLWTLWTTALTLQAKCVHWCNSVMGVTNCSAVGFTLQERTNAWYCKLAKDPWLNDPTGKALLTQHQNLFYILTLITIAKCYS